MAHVSEDAFNGFILKLFLCRESTKLMKEIAKNCTSDKGDNETLRDYFFRTHIYSDEEEYETDFDEPSRDKLQSDLSGNEFDINLWLKVLKKLPSFAMNDWKTKDTLEYYLQNIKDIRNHKVGHGRMLMSSDTSSKIFDEIKCTLLEAWKLAGENFDYYEFYEIAEKEIKSLRTTSCQDVFNNELITLKEFARTENKKSLSALCLVQLSLNKIVKVEEIFYDLGLEYIAHRESTILGDFMDIAQGHISLIEGHSGTGKSMLLKFIIAKWIADNNSGSVLDYDFILPINFRVETNMPKTLSSVAKVLMPKSYETFSEVDAWQNWLLEAKILMLIDNTDDMNESYIPLLTDAQKFKNLTIICTCRSENAGYIHAKLPSDTKRLKLQELSDNCIEPFVKLYCTALHRQREEDSVLSFLRKTSPVLRDEWKIPLNLSTWAVEIILHPETLDSTTTFKILHKLHEVRVDKFLKRLANTKSDIIYTCNSSQRGQILEIISVISKASLEGLGEKSLCLNDSAVSNIRTGCMCLNINPEDILPAFFLGKLSTDEDCVSWGYSSENQKQHLAALHIYDLITGKHKYHDIKNIRNAVMTVLRKNEVPPHKFLDIMSETSEKLFEENSLSLHNALEKLQNLDKKDKQIMFTHLIGLFHNKSLEVSVKVVEETVNQLKKSSVLDNNVWNRVFNNIIFREDVVRLIYKRPGLIVGTQVLPDISLTKLIACGNQFQNNYSSDSDITKNLFDILHFDEFLKSLIIQKCCITTQHLEYLFHHPEFRLEDTFIEKSIIEWMSARNSDNYKGPLTVNMKIQETTTSLLISIANHESYNALKHLLHRRRNQFKCLGVCINVSMIDLSNLEPLPSSTNSLCTVYLPGIVDETTLKAAQIACAIQCTSLFCVKFPRCEISKNSLRALFSYLSSKNCRFEICLPLKYEGQTKSKQLTITYKNFGSSWE